MVREIFKFKNVLKAGVLGYLGYKTWEFLEPVISLREQYQTDKSICWAIVTGATSGIGYEFALQLANQGFNILVVARSVARAQKVCEELQNLYKVKTATIIVDLEHFPSEEYSAEKFLTQVEEAIGSAKLKMLMCSAGMSDLAVHFTDKPLNRNLSLVRLNVISTFALVQTLIPRLIRDGMEDKIKGGIVTLSAVTSIVAAPTFATSTANKTFVRAFTKSIAYEYEDQLRIMVANPLAVESGIVKGELWNIIPAKKFVSGILRAFTQGAFEASGCLSHDLQAFYYRNFASQRLVNFFYYFMLKTNSRILERPIDTRPIEQKLGFKQ